MGITILHTSDLHLGRAFGRFADDIRGRLREARHGAIARLAEAARSHGAGHVLVAGDTFDAETPSPATLRQALQAMAAEPDILWLLLPGNHDSLAASELWRRIASDAPGNVRALTLSLPLALTPGCHLLPAPCPARRPGRDLTQSLMAPTPDGALRIGLAHGGVTDFGSDGGDAALIPPDRAARANLDYLALGDWHGQLRVDARTWYSGTPETDAFKHAATGATGAALVVRLAAPGAPPEVQSVATGTLTWAVPTLDLLPGDDPADRLAAAMPPAAARRDTLLRLTVQGILRLPARAALDAALAAIAPDFGHFETVDDALATEAAAGDLDLIAPSGALRQAADALLAETESPDPETARIATAALARLFAFANEAAA